MLEILSDGLFILRRTSDSKNRTRCTEVWKVWNRPKGQVFRNTNVGFPLNLLFVLLVPRKYCFNRTLIFSHSQHLKVIQGSMLFFPVHDTSDQKIYRSITIRVFQKCLGA